MWPESRWKNKANVVWLDNNSRQALGRMEEGSQGGPLPRSPAKPKGHHTPSVSFLHFHQAQRTKAVVSVVSTLSTWMHSCFEDSLLLLNCSWELLFLDKNVSGEDYTDVPKTLQISRVGENHFKIINQTNRQSIRVFYFQLQLKFHNSPFGNVVWEKAETIPFIWGCRSNLLCSLAACLLSGSYTYFQDHLNP